MSEKKKKIIPIAILTCSFLVTVYYNYIGYRHTEATALNVMVKEITDKYRIYQILATMILYLIGYIIAIPFCKKIHTNVLSNVHIPLDLQAGPKGRLAQKAQHEKRNILQKHWHNIISI